MGRPQCTCPDIVVNYGLASTPAGPYLKVGTPIGEVVGMALVKEVDVFDEQAEEGNDNLEGTG